MVWCDARTRTDPNPSVLSIFSCSRDQEWRMCLASVYIHPVYTPAIYSFGLSHTNNTDRVGTSRPMSEAIHGLTVSGWIYVKRLGGLHYSAVNPFVQILLSMKYNSNITWIIAIRGLRVLYVWNIRKFIEQIIVLMKPLETSEKYILIELTQFEEQKQFVSLSRWWFEPESGSSRGMACWWYAKRWNYVRAALDPDLHGKPDDSAQSQREAFESPLFLASFVLLISRCRKIFACGTSVEPLTLHFSVTLFSAGDSHTGK